MEFIPFKRNHLEQVLSIAERTLGANYLTPEKLSPYFNSNSFIAFVILENNEVLGFISSVILTPSQLKDSVLKENDWFFETSKSYAKIALQKQVIVHPNYIGKGYGTLLVQLSSQVIEALCDFQLSTVWIKPSNNAMSHLLLKNGFERSKTIPNYWKEDSLAQQYNCPECGTPPCLCATEVFSKKNAPALTDAF